LVNFIRDPCEEKIVFFHDVATPSCTKQLKRFVFLAYE